MGVNVLFAATHARWSEYETPLRDARAATGVMRHAVSADGGCRHVRGSHEKSRAQPPVRMHRYC